MGTNIGVCWAHLSVSGIAQAAEPANYVQLKSPTCNTTARLTQKQAAHEFGTTFRADTQRTVDLIVGHQLGHRVDGVLRIGDTHVPVPHEANRAVRAIRGLGGKVVHRRESARSGAALAACRKQSQPSRACKPGCWFATSYGRDALEVSSAWLQGRQGCMVEVGTLGEALFLRMLAGSHTSAAPSQHHSRYMQLAQRSSARVRVLVLMPWTRARKGPLRT